MKSILGIGTLVAATIVCSGCASKNSVSDSALASNPTPELSAASMRNADVKFSLAYMRDINSRLFWNDVARWAYWDHPSRLSPYPTMDLNGQPR